MPAQLREQLWGRGRLPWRCAARRWLGPARLGSQPLRPHCCSCKPATRWGFGRACHCPRCWASWQHRQCERASGGTTARPRPARRHRRPRCQAGKFPLPCCTQRWTALPASRHRRGLTASCVPWARPVPTPTPPPRPQPSLSCCLPSTGRPGDARAWPGTRLDGVPSPQRSWLRACACLRQWLNPPMPPPSLLGQFQEKSRH